MKISVIIPTLNEGNHVANAVTRSFSSGADEVIVCDGGSSDSTVRLAKLAGAQVIRSRPGRGIQLNRGAEHSQGDILVFLHADNWPEPLAFNQIRNLVPNEEFVWGGFKQVINNRARIFRLIEFGNACRLRYRGMAFGDQAMFATRSAYEKVGGLETIPLMEDVKFSDSLNLISKPILLPGPIHVDARRWERNGPIRTTIQNWNLFRKYRQGVSVEALANEYYGKGSWRNPPSELAKSEA